MRVSVVTQPQPAVLWADADAHLRLGGVTAEQTYVEGLIAAATAHIDGPEGWLGRAIGVQTLEMRMDAFPQDDFKLPFPPSIDIISVKYLDGSGVEQTVDNSLYELRGSTLGLSWNSAWPAAARHPEAVRIRYDAGYAEIPAPIRAAILIMTADLYRFRESAAAGQMSEVPMSTTVCNLLSPFRIIKI